MRIIFAGTPDTAIPTFEAVCTKHEVVAVLTRAPAKVGRKRILTNSPIHEYALAKGIPVLTPYSLKDAEVQAEISAYKADAVVVVAYGMLIPQDLLQVTKFGWFNLHFSLLPKWRGAAPVQAAIANGEKVTGTTVFRIDAGLDTGDIVNIMQYPISPAQTASEVLAQLALSGAQQVLQVLADLENGVADFSPQVGTPTHAPRLCGADAQIVWNELAPKVQARIHAYINEPGSWTRFGKQRIKLGKVIPTTEELPPGQIAVIDNRVLVGTLSQALELSTVIPEGKKEMLAIAWARGIKTDMPTFELVEA